MAVDKLTDKRICYVRWIDSSTLAMQCEPHEIPEPVVIESVGYVVAETDDFITLAQMIHADGDYRFVCTTPKVAVHEIRELRWQ